jgi:hypothetical protein
LSNLRILKDVLTELIGVELGKAVSLEEESEPTQITMALRELPGLEGAACEGRSGLPARLRLETAFGMAFWPSGPSSRTLGWRRR